MSSYSDWIGRNVPDVIMEDAAAWMALLDSPDCSAADRVSFARWLSEDPMHRWAFEELSEVWARLRSLTDMQELADQPPPLQELRRHVACGPAAPFTSTRRPEIFACASP